MAWDLKIFCFGRLPETCWTMSIFHNAWRHARLCVVTFLHGLISVITESFFSPVLDEASRSEAARLDLLHRAVLTLIRRVAGIRRLLSVHVECHVPVCGSWSCWMLARKASPETVTERRRHHTWLTAHFTTGRVVDKPSVTDGGWRERLSSWGWSLTTKNFL